MTIDWDALELREPVLKADGFDDAVIGIGSRCGQPDLVVYDAEKCVEVLQKQGMTLEEAEEYFEFNVAGSWMGPHTPIFMRRLPDA